MGKPTQFTMKGSVFTLLLSIVLSACTQASLQASPQDNKKKSATPSKAEVRDTQIGEAISMKNKTFNAEQQVNDAKVTLAKMLKTDVNDIKLLQAKPVTWRNGALGCPEPGKSYTMALVKGTLIVLAHNSKHYRFHAKQNGKAFHCPNTRVESPTSNSADI